MKNKAPRHKAPLHKAPLHIVQALYQMDIAKTDLERILKDFPDWQKALADENARAHFEAVMRDVITRKDQLDALIAVHLPSGWPLERLNKALLAILRAGASELNLRPEDAHAQIVRQYVDVAYDLLDDKTAAMANAVLDKIKNA